MDGEANIARMRAMARRAPRQNEKQALGIRFFRVFQFLSQ